MPHSRALCLVGVLWSVVYFEIAPDDLSIDQISAILHPKRSASLEVTDWMNGLMRDACVRVEITESSNEGWKSQREYILHLLWK